MKTEKFFEAFTELDDDLIENAFPTEQEPEVVRPAKRKASWQPFAAAAAIVVLVCGTVLIGMKLGNMGKNAVAPIAPAASSDGEAPREESSAPSKPDDFTVKYSHIVIDEMDYFSDWELVGAADAVLKGWVRDIRFELHNEHTGEFMAEYGEHACLCTVYDISITEQYKGGIREQNDIQLIMYCGLEDYAVDTQAELLEWNIGRGIPVLYDPPEIERGDEYLFLLRRSDYDGSGMMQLVNNCQSVIPANDPQANGIINCCLADLSVIHNREIMELSDEKDALLSYLTVINVTSGAPYESTFNSELTEQQIEEFRTNGYVITLKYNYPDIDDTDKTEEIITEATIYVSETEKTGYLSFSSIGNCIHSNTHTSWISSYYRNMILNVLSTNSAEVSVIHNGEAMELSDEKDALLSTLMEQALTEGGYQELDTELSERQIAEFESSGYILTLKYNYADTPEIKDGCDQNFRLIGEVTVLIGEKDEAYLTYSYAEYSAGGTVEDHSSTHTYLLSDYYRTVIRNVSSTSSAEVSVIHNGETMELSAADAVLLAALAEEAAKTVPISEPESDIELNEDIITAYSKIGYCISINYLPNEDMQINGNVDHVIIVIRETQYQGTPLISITSPTYNSFGASIADIRTYNLNDDLRSRIMEILYR